MTRMLAVALAAFALVGTAACEHKVTTCSVSGSYGAGLPRLRRAGYPQTFAEPVGPLCIAADRHHQRDRCERTDDLSTMLGTGVTCAPSGVEHVHDCPSFEALEPVEEPPSIVVKPCGDDACPNRQLRMRNGHGMWTRVVFYDDPACRMTVPEPLCAAASRSCYYRVLSVVVSVSGDERP